MSARRIAILAITTVATLCFVAIYFFYDPSTDNLFPRCPFLMLTGLKCPGCGSQRAIHSLLCGHPLYAWHFNAAFVAFLPLVAIYLISEMFRTRFNRLYRLLNSTTIIWCIFTVIILWWITRNIFGW